MKNLYKIILPFLAAIVLAGCSAPTDVTTNTSDTSAELTVADISREESSAPSSEAESENSSDNGETNIFSEENQTSEETSMKSNIAVVYFSATGNTRDVANLIAEETGGDIYEIIPLNKYSDEDINYSNDDSRANKEMDDKSARPEIENDLSILSQYETVYIGYPIWWGTAPRIIDTLLDNYDLSNAKLYTFCTSGGSGIETSISDLQSAHSVSLISGRRFRGAVRDDVASWIESLN